MSFFRQFEPVLCAANDDHAGYGHVGAEMKPAALRELLEPVKLDVTGWACHPLPQIHLGYRAFRLAHGLVKPANDAQPALTPNSTPSS